MCKSITCFTFIQLSTEMSVATARQIIEAVHYMHTHVPMVIHQDLKPHNILVCLPNINFPVH